VASSSIFSTRSLPFHSHLVTGASSQLAYPLISTSSFPLSHFHSLISTLSFPLPYFHSFISTPSFPLSHFHFLIFFPLTSHISSHRESLIARSFSHQPIVLHKYFFYLSGSETTYSLIQIFFLLV